MNDRVTVDESLEGKRVVASDGNELGRVAGVGAGTMYVDLDPGLTDRHLAKLGWDDGTDADYPLGTDAIDAVRDGTVHVHDL